VESEDAGSNGGVLGATLNRQTLGRCIGGDGKMEGDELRGESLMRLTDESVPVPVPLDVDEGAAVGWIAEKALVRVGNKMDVMVMMGWTDGPMDRWTSPKTTSPMNWNGRAI
jgi:hypothetical protein